MKRLNLVVLALGCVFGAMSLALTNTAVAQEPTVGILWQSRNTGESSETSLVSLDTIDWPKEPGDVGYYFFFDDIAGTSRFNIGGGPFVKLSSSFSLMAILMERLDTKADDVHAGFGVASKMFYSPSPNLAAFLAQSYNFMSHQPDFWAANPRFTWWFADTERLRFGAIVDGQATLTGKKSVVGLGPGVAVGFKGSPSWVRVALMRDAGNQVNDPWSLLVTLYAAVPY